jgi:hypothetical protein
MYPVESFSPGQKVSVLRSGGDSPPRRIRATNSAASEAKLKELHLLSMDSSDNCLLVFVGFNQVTDFHSISVVGIYNVSR